MVGEFILPKHLKDLNVDWDTFTMDDVKPLIQKIVKAVKFCAGPEKAEEMERKFKKIAYNAKMEAT